MKVLVIGSKGMLGTMLCSVLADMQPVKWDKDDIDITDFETCRQRLITVKPDVIINAAAYTNVDGAEEDRETAMAVNAVGVKNLSSAAKELGAVLVHYSTDYVFPGDREEGYAEDDKTGPAVNVYGESKRQGEEALLKINPDFYLLRIAWLYGPGGKNFVDTMLQLAETKDSLEVVDDQYGSPTFTKDVALVTKQLLESEKPFGVYHAVNKGVASWFDFAKEIFRLTDKDVKVNPVSSDEFPRPAKRPKYSVLKDAKNLDMRPWKEALEEYIENYLNTSKGEGEVKKKVVFLDRDGTINVLSGKDYVFKQEEWEWTEGAVEALKKLQEAGYYLAIITNQSGIGQGIYTAEDMSKLHFFMEKELAEEGVVLSHIAYCPHKRDSDCVCRKPKTGMAEEIEANIGPIDYANSWTVGDKLADVKFGQNIGSRTALIRSSYWREDDIVTPPDLIVNSLLEATRKIV